MEKLRKSFKLLLALVAVFLINTTQDVYAQGKSLLWEISGNGLEKPSYIYGTIHVICKDDMVMAEATKTALSNSEQIVLELDMDDPQLMTKMGQLSMNEGMANISEKLSDEDKAALNTFFKENYGADLNQLGVMKPIALLSMMIPKALTCKEQASYEAVFVQMKGEKEVKGLETVEYQMSIFDNIPQEEQLSWLTEYAKNPEQLKSEFNALIEAYKKQDVEAMHELVSMSPQFEEFSDVLLYKRNKEWIERINKLVEEKPSFIAVGAGHLGSDKGVLALLKKEGYKVKAVK